MLLGLHSTEESLSENSVRSTFFVGGEAAAPERKGKKHASAEYEDIGNMEKEGAGGSTEEGASLSGRGSKGRAPKRREEELSLLG